MVCMICLRSISLPSISLTASLRVAAHHWDMPALTEVGASVTAGGIKPSLPANPSRIPGKKLASRGCSITSPIRTHWDTSMLARSGT